MKNKNILITGGLGFVGSHLAEKLSKYNNVYVIDNLFTGSKKNKVKNVKYKCSSTVNIFKLYKNIKLNYIFHLGEYSRVEQSFEDIDLVYEFNVSPFHEVIKLTKHHNAKLIYCGSSTKFAKYDKSTHLSPYAWSKKNNVQFLEIYNLWFGLKYAVTYFYNVYGEREIKNGKYATVIAKFMDLKKNHSPYLPVTKPGTQKRNFTHINDIIAGLIVVAKKGVGDGYGIGAAQSYSILDLAKIIGMPVKMTKFKKGNRITGTLKTNKTKSLGWKQKYNLKDYIKSKIN